MNQIRLCHVPLLGLSLLCGCEQDLNVELAGSALDGAEAVVVQVSSVQLLKSDGSTVTLSLDGGVGEDIDVVSLQNGTTLQLLSQTDDFEGDYVGVRPVFASTGNLVRESDGTEVNLELRRQADYADIDFSLKRRESVELVMELSLPFSVSRPDEDEADYVMRPVVRAALRDEAGSLEGAIELSLLTQEACQDGRNVGDGVAVYLFEDHGRTPVDYFDSDSHTVVNLPVASAPAFRDPATDTWQFRFQLLPPGEYTAAITCKADAERPAEQDDLEFGQPSNVTISSGSDTELDFEAD